MLAAGRTSGKAGGKLHRVRNFRVARLFYEIASLLEIRDESRFRIRAWQRAAQTLETLSEDVTVVAAHLDPAYINGARAAASVMGMNNIYYRFLHLVEDPEYAQMPARLRMQMVARHGSDPVDFELWCLAVSAINACGTCVDAHEKVLKEKGIGEETILAAVRIASTIHGLAAVVGG